MLLHDLVFLAHEPGIAADDADDFHIRHFLVNRLDRAAYGRVEPGAIPAARQDSYASFNLNQLLLYNNNHPPILLGFHLCISIFAGIPLRRGQHGHDSETARFSSFQRHPADSPFL